MIKFAHISPYQYMEEAHRASKINLTLAHLVGDNEYTKFYASSSLETIMDNGAFELGKSLDPSRLVDLAYMVKANYVVLPDYPGQPASKGIVAAEKAMYQLKSEGFKVMFVPQSPKGDFVDLMAAWDWAVNNPSVDLIGNSILAAPNALPLGHRLISRYHVLNEVLAQFGAAKTHKRIHMLGMLDSVHEIALVKAFHSMINSWDSSAAVWYGMNHKLVSQETKKFELPVDFKRTESSQRTLQATHKNLVYINRLCD